MGITIHYRFGIYDEQSLERALRDAKRMAENVRLEIRDFTLTSQEKVLIIKPDENSETINLEFRKWGEIKSTFENRKEWDYTYDVMKH
jgi:uncharacterized protein YcfL